MVEEFHKYRRRAEKAFRQIDADATPAQRDALRARVGRLHIHGLDLRVEYKPGDVRRGVGADGKPWERAMQAAYGRIKRTQAKDGDQADFYLGEHPESQLVFVISQLTPDGSLDEHKCVLGCRNYKEARALYLAHYPAGWADERLGEVRGFTTKQFKDWLASEAPVKNKGTRKAAFPEFLACLSPPT